MPPLAKHGWVWVALAACSCQRRCSDEEQRPVNLAADSAPRGDADSGSQRPAAARAVENHLDASPWDSLRAICDRRRKRLVLYDSDVVEQVRGLAKSAAGRADLARVTGGATLRAGDAVFDCELGGQALRVKLGTSNPMPYGQCGGDPPRWLSLWLNRIKVLSGRTYSGRCHETPLATVTVDAEGMTWCTAKAEMGGVVRPGLECETTRWSSSDQAIDTLEYPTSSVPKPKVGDILIEHASDQRLCQSLIAPRKERQAGEPPLRPPAGTDITLREGKDASCFLDVGQFDLDNDGRADHVYRRRCFTNGQDGDEYYVVPRALSMKGAVCGSTFAGSCPGYDGDFMKRIRRESRLIIPEVWKNTDNSDLEYRVQHRSSSAPSAATQTPGARHYTIVLRYLHLTPFRYDGVTYLLSSPPDHALDTEDTYFVLRPRSNGPPDEVCVFHQVQEHF